MAYLLLLSSVLAAAGTAHASPITYTFSGIFSGSLGGVSFTDTSGVFSLSTDTMGVQSQAGGNSNTASGATFTLSGHNAANFTSSTFGVESEYGAASFMDAMAGFAVGVYNDGVIPDDVLSTIGGPYSGIFVSYGAAAEATRLGDLIITDGSNVTFSTLSGASTPEPSSLLLGGTGLLMIASMVRRRLAKA